MPTEVQVVFAPEDMAAALLVLLLFGLFLLWAVGKIETMIYPEPKEKED